MLKNYFSLKNQGERFFHYGAFFVVVLIMIFMSAFMSIYFNQNSMFRVNFQMKSAYLNDRGYVRVSTDLCFATDTRETLDCPEVP